MEHELILRRRQEVTEEIGRLQKRISEMEKELVELDTAERVFARLTGAERGAPSATDKREPETPSGGKPEGIPTMPEMIKETLQHAPVQGGRPKAVRDRIARHYWPSVKVEAVSSIMWRMWKRGELEKVGSRYMLPQKNETDDANLGEETSSASLFQPRAQGREAVPGGGT